MKICQKNLRYGKSLYKLLDLDAGEIEFLLRLSGKLKQMKKEGRKHSYLSGKNIALIFEKTSTRTRNAFEIGAFDMGGNGIYIDPSSTQMGRKESPEDTAKVFGRFFDGICYRGFSHEQIENFGRSSGVPLWNALSDSFHPTQVLADLLTIQEQGAKFKDTRLVFMGDGKNNLANSLMSAAAILGMDFCIGAPETFRPSEEILSLCLEKAEKSGAKISFESDPEAAVKGADFVYTDVWLSLGEDPSLWEERIKVLRPYQVNEKLMKLAGKTAKFLHCLPAFHDLETSIGREVYEKYKISAMEVTDEVFRSEASLVFDEAENRLHTIKAVMAASLSEEAYA